MEAQNLILMCSNWLVDKRLELSFTRQLKGQRLLVVMIMVLVFLPLHFLRMCYLTRVSLGCRIFLTPLR
jgi:hypothetical protein